ncbi:YaiI/YqxD family protein [bacterium]|nr:YaiI/YqxD family protein [bacterium]
MPLIYIDADACPVKDETYKVADRYLVPVCVVANSWMRIPHNERVTLEVVPGDFDAADDWIADRAGPGDIVVTGDIPLAARCIDAGARVLGTRGEEFTEAAIGDALAMRALKDHLRQTGEITGGPPPMDKKFRSRFLAKLDEMINALR